MNIYEKLQNIQKELKAPKNQFNNFGKYKYRSTEDILEAVKPLLDKNNCILTISDALENIGERYYVKAIATIKDSEMEISVSAYAREDDNKKGMDLSQLTGSTSSYARKYALNGLFCIDDTKDSDSTNKHNNNNTNTNSTVSEAQLKRLFAICKVNNVTGEQAKEMIIEMFGKNNSKELTKTEYDKLIKRIEEE